MKIRVLLADDHVLLRVGVAGLINQQPDMEVVAQTPSGSQAVALYRQHRPDVTIMDLRMPDLDGAQATAAIRDLEPAARVLVLTINKGDEAVFRAIRAGARGYLLKDVPPQELLDAIRTIHRGQRCIPPDVAAKLADRIGLDELTPREVAVLKLVASGLSNKRIADRLDSTENAIKHVLAGILSKLGANDRAHAVALAVERAIIDLDDLELRDGGKSL
jgi:DNA-binding NarL/FixJ family response regulator